MTGRDSHHDRAGNCPRNSRRSDRVRRGCQHPFFESPAAARRARRSASTLRHFTCGSGAPKGHDAAMKQQPPQHPNAKGGTSPWRRKQPRKQRRRARRSGKHALPLGKGGDRRPLFLLPHRHLTAVRCRPRSGRARPHPLPRPGPVAPSHSPRGRMRCISHQGAAAATS